METQATTAVVSAGKDVNPYTVHELRNRLREAIGRHASVAVDLEGTTYIDSAGLAVIIGARKRARTHGCEFYVICTREAILRLFRITSLDTVLDIRSSAGPRTDETVPAPAAATPAIAGHPAVLIPPPDMPGYDELPDGLEARAALPARFHIPVWEDTSDRAAFLCAVCYDEGESSLWPCATAARNGDQVFADEQTVKHYVAAAGEERR